MIDKEDIMLDDNQGTLAMSFEKRMDALNRTSTFLGNLHDTAILRFYNIADEQYEHIYNMLKFMQEEYSSHTAVERFKWANGLHYDDLSKYYLQFLSKDLLGKILDEDEIKNAEIKQYNKNLIDNIDMDNNEIVHKINKAMYEQQKSYLQQNHPEYNLNDEDGIKELYYMQYSEIFQKILQLSVDMEELHKLSHFIDLHNIIEEQGQNDDENNDIELEEI